VILHVFRGEIAWTVPLRGKTDDGDRSLLRQDSAQAGDVVDDRHGLSLMEIGDWRIAPGTGRAPAGGGV
jgi:hypothetical protein